jgi:hypothetical protein
MALGIDSTLATSTSTTNPSFSFTNTAGNMMVLAIQWNSGASLNPTITYNGVSMTQGAIKINTNTSAVSSALYYLKNPATGSNTVAISSFATGTPGSRIGIVTFTGASGNIGSNIVQAQQDSVTAVSEPITTTTANSYIVESVMSGGQTLASSITLTSGQTLIGSGQTPNGDTSTFGESTYKSTPSITTYTETYTLGKTNRTAFCIIEVLPSAPSANGNFLAFM